MFKLVKSPTVKHSLYTVGFRSLCSPVRSGFFSITLLVCVVEGISRVTTMSFIVATDAHCHSILAETTVERQTGLWAQQMIGQRHSTCPLSLSNQLITGFSVMTLSVCTKPSYYTVHKYNPQLHDLKCRDETTVDCIRRPRSGSCLYRCQYYGTISPVMFY